MRSFPIGVILESFASSIPTAIQKASRLGLTGVQLYADEDYAPQALSPARRRDLLHMLKDHGLELSALGGDLGVGFHDTRQNEKLIDQSKRVLDLALDLETNIVTMHFGVIPSDPRCDRYQIMQEACGRLSEYAADMHAYFAIETGPEPSATLRAFLDSIGSRGIGVNLDPANLAMVIGEDAADAVYGLRDHIVHTHAKDGIRLIPCDPEVIYAVTPGQDELRDIAFFREAPLGKGQVDFSRYLKALDDIGYRGYLTIEQEISTDPDGDIAQAADYLRRLMAES